MKRQFSILLHIFLLLALCACGAACQSTRAPDIVDTWSPPPEAEGIVPLSCDEIEQVFAYDPQAPLDIQETSRRGEWGVTIIDLTYASPMGGRVPATLIVPDDAGPFAGTLYQHGMPSTRQPYIPDAVAYARRGAVVLLIDAPFARRAGGLENAVTHTEQDRREQIQLIIDLRRGVDLLLSRPDVDPERLAYVGGSYGGRMGGLLAGVEHRLKAYVLLSGGGGLVSYETDPERRARWHSMSEYTRRRWVAWMWPIEPIHYVGCASPAALLFQNGTLDTWSTPADALRYQEAGSEPKTILWYNAGHQLNTAAARDQVEWLSERIGISARAPIPRGVEIVLTAWFVAVAASLVLVGLHLWRSRPTPLGSWLAWLLTTAFLGPLGLWICWINRGQTCSERETQRAASPGRRALGSAAWAAAGNMPGVIGILAVVLYAPLVDEMLGKNLVLLVATTLFLLPFSAGALTFALTRWLSRSDTSFRFSHSRPLFVETVSTCLVLAAAFPIIITVIAICKNFWNPFAVDLFYPPFWGAFCLAALAGMIVTYPFHLWMIRRGLIAWGLVPAVPRRGLAWYWKGALLLASFAVLLGAIFLSIQLV
jgi:dienelactone hydrolase